jgi:hypothetical protein
MCPGTVTVSLAADDVMFLARREVVGPVPGAGGREIGLEFSGDESVVRVNSMGANTLRDSRYRGRIRALAIDLRTGNLVIAREGGRTRLMAGWMRTLAGHPMQRTHYEVQIVDKQGRSIAVVAIATGEPDQSVDILQ